MDNRQLILLVDDEPGNLRLAQTILKDRYRLAAVTSGRQALQFLERNQPDLALLDINMPDMDGWETLAAIHAREESKSLPVIFLTGDNDAETETKCFSAGAIDFIGKPFIPQVLLERIRRVLEIEMYRKHLEEMVASKVEQITRMQQSVITSIANLIEMRDDSTGAHVKKTQLYVSFLVNELLRRGLYPEILTPEYAHDTIRAAVLHDVGKIRVPDAILLKPGRLTDEEYEQIKLHASYGDVIVKTILGDVEDEAYISVACKIARHHHERWDGKGYPDGLKGNEIPLCARIMALADVYDALAAERCYKKPVRPIERVFDMLRENAGTQFDPELTDIFLQMSDRLKAVAEAN